MYIFKFADDLGITDKGDRVTILQNLTTMRADLVTTSHTPRRNHSAIKGRRFSETATRRTSHARPLTRQSASSSSVDRAMRPLRYGPRASPRMGSPTKYHSESLRPASPGKYPSPSPSSSRLASPVKGLGSPTKLMHYVLETDERQEDRIGQAENGETNHKRYLSRSMDRLLQVSPAISQPTQKQHSTPFIAVLATPCNSMVYLSPML